MNPGPLVLAALAIGIATAALAQDRTALPSSGSIKIHSGWRANGEGHGQDRALDGVGQLPVAFDGVDADALCVAMERISRHSSMLRPRRESSETMMVSPLPASSRIAAIRRLRQGTVPETRSSTNSTWPSRLWLARARMAALFFFFSVSWSMVETRR